MIRVTIDIHDDETDRVVKNRKIFTLPEWMGQPTYRRLALRDMTDEAVSCWMVGEEHDESK